MFDMSVDFALEYLNLLHPVIALGAPGAVFLSRLYLLGAVVV